jgi:signal transduction histidine kinase
MTATDLMAPPVPAGSTGSSDTRPDFAGAEQRIRFGVAFRLLIAFAAITAFAAFTSAIALYTFGKFGDGFNRIASSSLPALVAASDLAQRSESLAANAPNLAVADGHFNRRAISEVLGNQLRSIADAGGRIRKLAPSTVGLVSLTQNEALLKDNIQKLDGLVAEKIDADRVATNSMLRLRTLSVRIRTADSDLLSKLAGQQTARTQADALSAWIAAADEAIVILLSTASADTTIRLNRLREEFTEASNRSHTARAQFETLLADVIDPLEQALSQYGHGSPNVFDVRTAQLTSASAVRGALLDTKNASVQFVASAEQVFADVQEDARTQSDYFRQRISEYSRLFTVLSLLCVGGAGAVFFYINRSIIQRLRSLSHYMRASVFGRTAPITISGNDEISDMARAADFFVASLAQREKGLRESVEELQALGEVIQAVNSSVDLETVLTTIVAKATQLSGTDAGAIYVFDDVSQEFRLRATYGLSDSIVAEIRDSKIRVGQTAISEAVERRTPIQIPDVLDDPSVTLDVIVRAGFRALLYVPLLGSEDTVGALIVRRKQPGEFPKNTIELLQTFAAQSVLAIQNARLFESVEARTQDLMKSLEELRTTQDRLVQTEKLASLGQLTAGIAHEIKNPLNFINNFSTLSTELITEMTELLSDISLDKNKREELDQVTQLLKGNLEKVVQHGKRADSIVKNMLLHSRESSGEQRPADINALLDDSLNLAYHGARVEAPGFSITLQRDFDAGAGVIESFPQEVTRAFINLISNGFYAAAKRQKESEGSDFEPVLRATTKNLGNRVEVRIRDNGTGIPAGVKDKMFNPFFTTKPAGEGTGLGLSMSHDIIVKQHGGSIDVETEPGQFTEFTIVLPRTSR